MKNDDTASTKPPLGDKIYQDLDQRTGNTQYRHENPFEDRPKCRKEEDFQIIIDFITKKPEMDCLFRAYIELIFKDFLNKDFKVYTFPIVKRLKNREIIYLDEEMPKDLE